MSTREKRKRDRSAVIESAKPLVALIRHSVGTLATDAEKLVLLRCLKNEVRELEFALLPDEEIQRRTNQRFISQRRNRSRDEK